MSDGDREKEENWIVARRYFACSAASSFSLAAIALFTVSATSGLSAYFNSAF